MMLNFGKTKDRDPLDKRGNRGKLSGMSDRFSAPAPISAGLFRMGRHSLMLSGCLIAMLSCPAVAQVSEADGYYKPTRVSGSVRAAGKTYQLPIRALRKALLTRGIVPIKNEQLKIQRGKWGRVLQDFGFLGIEGPTTVSGPDKLVLKKKKNGFAGKTRVPLAVNMKGRYKWAPVTVTLKTRLDSKVIGDKFIVNAPIEIKVIGIITLNGSIQMEAKRLKLPPGFSPDGTR
jgi:hypothetical protein